jgi:mycofactocin precursor
MQQNAPTATTPTDDEGTDATADVRRTEEELVVDELLVEDVSIDGMCGVY